MEISRVPFFRFHGGVEDWPATMLCSGKTRGLRRMMGECGVKSILAFATVLLGATAVCAQEAPAGYGADGNEFVCSGLRSEIEAGGRNLNQRQLNVLFFGAVEKDCISVVHGLLARGASLEARDRFGNTPLLHAAAGGHENIIRLLLDRGSSIDEANLAGSSALSRAVVGNHRRAVELLLERGADIRAAGRGGVTPLSAAAFNGNARILDLLLRHGADPTEWDKTGKGPILYAAARGFAPMVARLLGAGVDPNEPYGHGLTALMWAAGHANDVPEADGVETVRLLLDRGADVRGSDDRGRTALMIAAERGHASIVGELLKRGADLTAVDKAGKTAVDLAADQRVRDALAEARPR